MFGQQAIAGWNAARSRTGGKELRSAADDCRLGEHSFFAKRHQERLYPVGKSLHLRWIQSPGCRATSEGSPGDGSGGSIKINEVRFVAADPTTGEISIAAQIAAQTLGPEFKQWLSEPQKLLQLIAAAEGAQSVVSVRRRRSSPRSSRVSSARFRTPSTESCPSSPSPTRPTRSSSGTSARRSGGMTRALSSRRAASWRRSPPTSTPSL